MSEDEPRQISDRDLQQQAKTYARMTDLFGYLQARLQRKFPHHKKAVNVLPPIDMDFEPLFTTLIDKNTERPKDAGRRDYRDQIRIIFSSYRERPEILAYHMLFISYLRRNTPHTKQAWSLYSRLWEDYGDRLLAILPTRDLISALRTFADYSPNETQRLTAKLGFVYGTLIKVYETERIVDGLDPQNATYDYPTRNVRLHIRGLFGIRFEADNSLEVINTNMVEEVNSDPIIGAMILALLERIATGSTIFSRADQARIAADYLLDKKLGWSFGYNPSIPLDEGD